MRFSEIGYTYAVKPFKVKSFSKNRLLEQCVAGTPARTVAALGGINKISATSFYHKLRLVIHDKPIDEVTELAGEVEVMKAILAVSERVSEEEALLARFRYSDY